MTLIEPLRNPDNTLQVSYNEQNFAIAKCVKCAKVVAVVTDEKSEPGVRVFFRSYPRSVLNNVLRTIATWKPEEAVETMNGMVNFHIRKIHKGTDINATSVIYQKNPDKAPKF